MGEGAGSRWVDGGTSELAQCGPQSNQWGPAKFSRWVLRGSGLSGAQAVGEMMLCWARAMTQRAGGKKAERHAGAAPSQHRSSAPQL